MDRFVIRTKNAAPPSTSNTVALNPVVKVSSPSTSIAERSTTVTSQEERRSKRQKTSAGRKYDENYLSFCFCAHEEEGVVVPQCVVCGELLANESLKPSKLKRHLETKHFNLKGKSLNYFQCLKIDLHKNKQAIKRYSCVSQSALKASFLVSYRIVKCLKPYTVGEELILPSAIDMCTEILGEKVANQLKVVPLSDTTVARRVSAISDDLRNQLVFRLKSVKFSIQLDESTDIANKAILLGYVRYFYDNEIHEDFLFSATLETTATGRDIFSTLMNFFYNKQCKPPELCSSNNRWCGRHDWKTCWNG